MPEKRGSDETTDPHELHRFVQAQHGSYDSALAEIRSGRKRSHWIWYTFPQIAGLGSSARSKTFSIRSIAEAEAFLRHPVLGRRLTECAEAALSVAGRSAREIFGIPDDMKLRSCATLFASVSAEGSVFHRLLDHFFEGAPDRRTLELLGNAGEDA